MRFELLQFSKKTFVQRPPSGPPKSSPHRLVFVVVVQRYFYYKALKMAKKWWSLWTSGRLLRFELLQFFQKNLCTKTSLGTSQSSPFRIVFVVVVHRYFFVKRFEHDRNGGRCERLVVT